MAWEGEDINGLEKEWERHAYDVVKTLKDAGAMPDMTQIALPLLKLHHARKNLQQRGFARAVRPNQYGLLTAFDREVHPRINPVWPIGHVDPLQIDRPLAAARRLRNLESEGLPRGQGFLDRIHALDLLELAHGLRSPGG